MAEAKKRKRQVVLKIVSKKKQKGEETSASTPTASASLSSGSAASSDGGSGETEEEPQDTSIEEGALELVPHGDQGLVLAKDATAGTAVLSLGAAPAADVAGTSVSPAEAAKELGASTDVDPFPNFFDLDLEDDPLTLPVCGGSPVAADAEVEKGSRGRVLAGVVDMDEGVSDAERAADAMSIPSFLGNLSVTCIVFCFGGSFCI